MNKICFLFNMAPQYVASSYVLIDRELSVMWRFGSNDTDIKEMDHTLLNDVKVLPTKRIGGGKAYYLKGALSLAFEKNVSSYVLLGEPGCLSMWILPLLIRLFHPSRKILFWTHGWYGREGKIKAMIKKLFFRPAHSILLYGNYARSLMIEAGFDPKRLYTIHNSLDHDRQVALRENLGEGNAIREHFKNDDPTLIFIGRLTTVKKIDMLLHAAALLCERGRKVNVLLVGDGEEKKSLETLASSLRISERVWFYGACYDEKTNAELIYNADICVSPGNVGLTAIHSLTFGTPVITHGDFTRQMPEFEAIKEGMTGMFFKHDDVKSLADTIEEWLSRHNDDREIIRRECQDEIDNNWTPEFELGVLKQALHCSDSNA